MFTNTQLSVENGVFGFLNSLINSSDIWNLQINEETSFWTNMVRSVNA